MGKNNLFDAEFMDDDNLDDDFFDAGTPSESKANRRPPAEDDDGFVEVKPEGKARTGDKANAKANTAKDGEIEIEIVDDTPDKDKGKWVADDAKDGEPDFPSEEEIKHYDNDVQKRIRRFTARVHAERRRADDLNRQLTEAQTLAKRLIERNNKLSDLVENGEKVLIGEHKGRIQSELAAAKNFYREAHEAGDANGMAAAQERIAIAAAALDRLSTHQPMRLERAKPEDYAPKPQAPSISAETQEWQERNKDWWGRDQAMTAFAMGVHAQLVQGEGIQPESQQYWRRLDHEIKKRFPERFQQRQTERRSIVAPATRSGSGGQQRVTLKESEVRLAKRLGLTNEQYAMQKLRDQQAGNI